MNVSQKNPIVYVAHHVDTEGPLYESVSETFKRIEEITGVSMPFPPTKNNLTKLQRGEGDFLSLDEMEKIKIIVSPHLLEYKSSWNEIDEMLSRILISDFRNKYKDSFGNGWIYNWHIMDHAGFETNPRHRDLGYLNIYDHYMEIFSQLEDCKVDAVEWHFHPIHYKRQANICATSYENGSTVLHQILCRRLIERNFFPRVNRAGLHTERPDSNWFLEQWIPFDASNQSVENDDYYSSARFGDWAGAPHDWRIYHPDIYDWRKIGGGNRYIARVLNLKTRFRNVTIEEIRRAFLKARRERCNVYLGVTDHDFREISAEIDEFYEMLVKVSREYRDVDFSFARSIDAFRKVIGITGQEEKIDLEFKIERNLLLLDVISGEPFGPQPYLAIKTKSGEYLHDNLDFGKYKQQYYYTFDIHTVPLDEIASVKVACNDKYGNQCIKKII